MLSLCMSDSVIPEATVGPPVFKGEEDTDSCLQRRILRSECGLEHNMVVILGKYNLLQAGGSWVTSASQRISGRDEAGNVVSPVQDR